MRLMFGALLFVNLGYVFFMLMEWMDFTHQLEAVENLLGASVPLMWAFFVYAYIQHSIREDLAVNKENLRITLNSIGDAVIATDVNGRITQMNPAAEALTGVTAHEALGRKIDEVLTLLDSANRKKINNPIEKVLESGTIMKLGTAAILQAKNLKEYYITDSAAPIFNEKKEVCGAVLVFSDMTERFIQDEKIRQNEERIKLAVSATKAGLWDWYMNTGKAIFDERWAENIGYRLEELEPISPDTWLKRVHPGDLVSLEEMIELHIKQKIDHIEHQNRLKHKNGNWLWVIVRGMIVQRDKQGNPLRMTGTVIDITSQKKAEDDLTEQMEENKALSEQYAAKNRELVDSIEKIKKINEELSDAKKSAEESYRLKSAFLANMSHEIRTPMNGIIGFSELMNDSNLPDERRVYFAKIIIDSSRQLLNIVNDILDISRMETGKVSLTYEEVVINDLINVLYAFFEPQAVNKKLELIASKPLKHEDSAIITDRTRVRQILTNLLNNAIKFTDKGQIQFGYKKTDGFIEFFVEDTGIGIPEELHEKIFEPFRQAELEITHQYGGTGLGLTISKKLAELLGGRIWLDSKPGEGSVFYFSLPVKPANIEEITEIKEEKTIRNKKYNMLVLVVEDDDVNYLFLDTILGKSGIRTIRAFNGIEAVDICNGNNDIQMVLMDIKLPYLNGYEATQRIKKIRPDLPIIAQTAYAMHEDRKKALDAGCDGYISKPIIASELIKLIDSIRNKKNL